MLVFLIQIKHEVKHLHFVKSNKIHANVKFSIINNKMEKIITYFNQKAKINCDENCQKAFGSNTRPRVYAEIPNKVFGINGKSFYPDIELKNEDDWAYLSDDELGIAPDDTGFYEGGFSKPLSKEEIPNKWCVRECERCNMSARNKLNEILKLKSFSKRVHNISK